MLPVAVGQSFYGGVAIRYVLPVLGMISCSHTMGLMARQVYAYNSTTVFMVTVEEH